MYRPWQLPLPTRLQALCCCHHLRTLLMSRPLQINPIFFENQRNGRKTTQTIRPRTSLTVRSSETWNAGECVEWSIFSGWADEVRLTCKCYLSYNFAAGMQWVLIHVLRLRSDLTIKEEFFKSLAVSDVAAKPGAQAAQGSHQKRRRLGLLNNLNWEILYQPWD